ncbi:MAG: homoserine O-acetyltransferase [Gammaproteobacteria bacterium]|nr:homoserine O-acetyltransferase [Gammaproteobacteria bacterium]MYE30086.1 homoserine O-acetyltransferase [Gammaproteobacteria bacterium]MYI02291.1 homoserine O-acetyltransferase [Gammaproteobacteria bacterium]
MNKENDQNSVGLIEPQRYRFDEPLILRSGKALPAYELMVETYGELNADHSNAVLICHALSGDHHAAGYHNEDDRKPGWWDTCIGPGKAIDTDLFHVVCLNNLGGCGGSTGPVSLNPETGKHYGPDFPIITVRDWVNSQVRLMDRLGIEKWAAVIGGSLGGMQVLRWAISYPERLHHAVAIAAAPKLSAQNIAFNEVARQSITNDPDFRDGHYLEHGVHPKHGLMLARMVGHITYLSDSAMRAKFGKAVEGLQGQKGNFGRDLRTGSLSFGFNVDFEVESYLRYQGEQFSEKFDANTYLLMTKALDYFDPSVDYEGDLSRAFAKSGCRFLLVSFSTDWRFPPDRSRELVDQLLRAGKQVSYLEIEADQGHDAFLLPIPRYVNALSAYLGNAHREICGDAS